MFPLLTTKKVFFRGIAEELFWFVKGSTNGNILKEKNVHIWDANGTKEFLESCGITDREEGEYQSEEYELFLSLIFIC